MYAALVGLWGYRLMGSVKEEGQASGWRMSPGVCPASIAAPGATVCDNNRPIQSLGGLAAARTARSANVEAQERPKWDAAAGREEAAAGHARQVRAIAAAPIRRAPPPGGAACDDRRRPTHPSQGGHRLHADRAAARQPGAATAEGAWVASIRARRGFGIEGEEEEGLAGCCCCCCGAWEGFAVEGVSESESREEREKEKVNKILIPADAGNRPLSVPFALSFPRERGETVKISRLIHELEVETRGRVRISPSFGRRQKKQKKNNGSVHGSKRRRQSERKKRNLCF